MHSALPTCLPIESQASFLCFLPVPSFLFPSPIRSLQQDPGQETAVLPWSTPHCTQHLQVSRRWSLGLQLVSPTGSALWLETHLTLGTATSSSVDNTPCSFLCPEEMLRSATRSIASPVL